MREEKKGPVSTEIRVLEGSFGRHETRERTSGVARGVAMAPRTLLP